MAPVVESPASTSFDAKSASPRLDYLDGLRGLAALYVMIGHGLWPFLHVTPANPALRLLSAASCYGHLFVDVFLVLSGFSLMLPVLRTGVLKNGTWDFYRRRARRILPPYFAVLAISFVGTLIVQAFSSNHAFRFHPFGLLVNALMLQDVFPQYYHEIDPATWTVAVEWKIYFLFPLLVWLLRRSGPAGVLLATGALGGLLTLFWHWHAPTTSLEHTCPWYVALFGVGVCACWASARPGLRGRLWALGGLALAGVFALLTILIPLLGSHQSLLMGLTDLSMGVAASCALALWRHRPPALPTRRPLVTVGAFAYSLYLFHMPLLAWWTTLLSDSLLTHLARRGFVTHVPGLSHALEALAVQTRFLHFQIPLLFLVAYPLTVALSYVFFLWCERPFLTARRHATPAEVARDAALSPAV